MSPFPSNEFIKVAREEIEMVNAQEQRHDLIQLNGKAGRGWSGLAMVMEPAEEGNQEIRSAMSE
jgi:hypothetical protein